MALPWSALAHLMSILVVKNTALLLTLRSLSLQIYRRYWFVLRISNSWVSFMLNFLILRYPFMLLILFLKNMTLIQQSKLLCMSSLDILGSTLGDACGQIKGPPMSIQLKKDVHVKALKVLTARCVPVHFKEAYDKLLRELLQDKVIVPVTEPTEWVSPAHVVPKPDGRVRLVTDYTVLNTLVDRPIHPFPSAKDLMQRIDPSSKYFAKVDAIHGYFQVRLSEESSLLTTFLLPSGRYRYTTLPMGLNASGDVFLSTDRRGFQRSPLASQNCRRCLNPGTHFRGSFGMNPDGFWTLPTVWNSYFWEKVPSGSVHCFRWPSCHLFGRETGSWQIKRYFWISSPQWYYTSSFLSWSG